MSTPVYRPTTQSRSRTTRLRALTVAVTLTLVAGLALTVSAVVTPAVAGADTPCPCSLWSSATTPVTVDSGDPNAVELGVQFSSATDGFISGVRFYKSSTNTGIHVGSLWTSGGTLLAQATFNDETTSGWQQVAFSQPVAVTAGTTYVAGYHTNTGHYSVDDGYFSGGAHTNGPLTAPGNATDPNGLFTYSATPTFPTGTFNGDNYWVDVVYSQTAPTPPPAATSLWGPDVTPTVVDSGDPASVELGVQFSSTTNGFVDGVRFYKSSANTGEHIGSLWTSDGTLLAQATFTDETTSGWQQVTFSQPVAVTAGTTYVAGYHTDTGHYSVDDGYFTNSGYVAPPLSAPGGNPDTPNGLFVYSPTPAFPTGTFNGDDYWVDVAFTPAPVPVSLTVSAPQAQVPKGLSEQLRATEGFSDGSSRDVTATATWTSSNPALTSVSSTGTVSAHGVGSAIVSVAVDGLTGSTQVTVVNPVAFALVDPPLVLLRTGQTRQLTLTAWLTNGTRLNVTDLATWSVPPWSLPPGARTSVSPTGLLSAPGPGLSLVTASLGRISAFAVALAVR